jgi:RNA polymerase sigma-70 factor (ECF subfamily)
VARLCLANAERARRRQERLVARIATLDPPTATTETAGASADEVGAALARLPLDDGEILRLWAWERLAPAEIARVLGVTANAVSLRLLRARKKLKAELGKPDWPAGHEESTRGRLP